MRRAGTVPRAASAAPKRSRTRLVALGVAQLGDPLEALDLGGERAVRGEEAPPREPTSDVGDAGAESRDAFHERGRGREEPRLPGRPPARAPHLEREPDDAQREQHRQQDLGTAGGERGRSHAASRG